jgi:hypothetical protein
METKTMRQGKTHGSLESPSAATRRENNGLAQRKKNPEIALSLEGERYEGRNPNESKDGCCRGKSFEG